MGGHIATPGALFIDMRAFKRVLAFDAAAKRITVQAGARWRDIQEHVDPAGLSVAIMQSYADFTVGGSLSVNAHGRVVGVGPLIESVVDVEVVLADGAVIRASRTDNADVFYSAIGGYGGVGVITEATLRLVDNIRMKRSTTVLAVEEYEAYFAHHVRGRAGVVLHNADLYPGAYQRLRAITYAGTTDPVSNPARLRDADQSSSTHRFGFWLGSTVPGGRFLRERLVDPLRFANDPVVWRNYEMSYDTSALEPASRQRSTYVLQEYFVPVVRFTPFVRRLRTILQEHDVNALNVSVRHVNADRGSLLSWAREDVFGFVIYYKQGTGAADRATVGRWTGALIEVALAEGGTFYLPYQLHATPEQFRRAYPRAAEFLAVKRKVDPTNKFRNEFWNKYGVSN
jgi:FAD/FMN-containing dehydrogenase